MEKRLKATLTNRGGVIGTSDFLSKYSHKELKNSTWSFVGPSSGATQLPFTID